MITCNLTKPETTLDQVKKSFSKLKPTDAAMIATGLVLSGRYAMAVYDETQYAWPEDAQKLEKAMMPELTLITQALEAEKKKKAGEPEEIIEVKVGLTPNLAMGERAIGDREDLKTLLADILQSGVEYVYSATDVGWQWSLERTNWTVLSHGELMRRVKLKAVFQDGSVGVEMGTGVPKKRASKKVVEEKIPDEPEETIEVPHNDD